MFFYSCKPYRFCILPVIYSNKMFLWDWLVETSSTYVKLNMCAAGKIQSRKILIQTWSLFLVSCSPILPLGGSYCLNESLGQFVSCSLPSQGLQHPNRMTKSGWTKMHPLHACTARSPCQMQSISKNACAICLYTTWCRVHLLLYFFSEHPPRPPYAFS